LSFFVVNAETDRHVTQALAGTRPMTNTAQRTQSPIYRLFTGWAGAFVHQYGYVD